jgi:diguanylate cyclase (GGDEF)-like protein
MPQPLQDADLRYVRVWLLVPLAVVVMAAGVLYSSDSQRRTAQTNFAEARTAQALLSDFLERERAYADYLATRDPDVFNRYLEEQRRVDAGLGAAEKTSVDDRAEREAVAAQRSVSQQWQTTARVELARVQAGRGPSRAADSYRDALVDRFAAANRNQQARLAEERHGSERRAALVPVWTILALSVLFGGVGAVLAVRVRRLARRRSAAKAAERADVDAFVSSQARFGEALQVAESQSEAHELLTRHLEKTIPGSEALVLNRNNSADRLEPVTVLAEGHLLGEPLEQAAPRSCLAVRLSRHYERSEAADEILECQICGKLPTESMCEPLLVGGEVIGSVIVTGEGRLDGAARRRIDESVSQAAPVLANLRNLAIAETRAATDVLTGLPNKRALDDTFKRMLAQAGRTQSRLAIVLFDIDHFKRINDTQGHDTGNEALAAVGALLREELRASDVAGRMGGDEFVMLLPDTDGTGALQLAEKVRQAMHRVRLRGLDTPMTGSFGVATFPDDSVEVDALMRIADRALYTAKQNGRDRVEAPSTVGDRHRAESPLAG